MMMPSKEAEKAVQLAKEADEEAAACETDVEKAKAVLQNAELRAKEARKQASVMNQAAKLAIKKVSQIKHDGPSLKARIASAWEERWSEAENKYYYYNTQTQGTTWNEPEGFQVNT